MQSNTDNFLIWGFQRILLDKDIKKSNNVELRKSCEMAMSELKVKIVENGVSSVLPQVKSEIDFNHINQKYFLPFELAFQSKSHSILAIALDCIQKLIAYGHISNNVMYKETNERLIEKIVWFICDSFQNGYSTDAVQLQIIKAILTVVINPNLEVHENYLITMVRTCYSIYLASRDSIIQTTAKATLTQMLNTIFNKMEMETTKEIVSANSDVVSLKIEEENNALEIVKEIIDSLITEVIDRRESTFEDTDDSFINTTETQSSSQKDAFLVFRSLCRLSMKPLPDGVPDPKSHDLRSKILSLELLLNILQCSGPVFRQSDIFINAIKQYLCVSLSKNGLSSVQEVFELSLSIFLSLLSNFKQHLKRQTEVFFKEIFLYILESPRSSFVQKDLVLEALKRICIDPQCVVDIYLNYDCELSLANVFERLVNDLAKIAQGKQTGDVSKGTEVKTLRVKSLDCLFHILQCMVEWSKELYVSPELQSYFGVEQERHEGIVGSGVAPTNQSQTGSSNSHNSSMSSLANISGHCHGSQSVFDNPEHFANRKQQKEMFEQGINLFNRKPLKGLNYLQSQDLLGTTVEDVAEFLHKEDRLDKTAIGDFLGDHDKYNIELMYAFVDQFDFTNKEFVAALRDFLSGFRLPGEAQKIDRLMEKFAARYCECNPGHEQFSSADTAYVLAYSIIMLTTDLHSAQIKSRHRMRKEDYIKMNRGINDRGDLAEDYLGKIYDEIADNEIKIKETSVDKRHIDYVDSRTAAVTTEKQRQLLFNMETEAMARAAKELMESISHVESDFTSATHHEHVRPMFQLVWTPFLAAFSVGLQDCDDTEISRHCLEGIRCAIRIACIFKMELERNAYIQALARFTLLITGSTTNGIKSKNIDTIKILISVAHTDGNYLGSSWLEILRCISQLESAQLIGGTGPPQNKTSTDNSATQLFSRRINIFNNANDNKKSNTQNPSSNASRSGQRSSIDVENIAAKNIYSFLVDHQRNVAILQEVMGETGSQSVVVAVDKVFTGSIRLDGDAIVDFVKALCQVSRDELSLPQPRIFSLQKLVEISYYNMGRIRLQWSRVWHIIGQHFTNAGQSLNEDVAIFAIDSLRQLAVKFIEKGEFPNFHFQKDFLRPFANIMENKSHVLKNVEDMVVRCVSQLVQSHWSNIRSGWTNVFTVFARAAVGASWDHEIIVEMAFDTCSFVVNEVIKTSFPLMIDSFQSLIKCLAEFACNPNFPDINMESIRLIRLCAKYVNEQGHLFKETTLQEIFFSSIEGSSIQRNFNELDDDDKVWLKGWMPVLCELFRVINNCKLDVRTRGLTVFFEILKSYGGHFKITWWSDIFSLVFKVFQITNNFIDSGSVLESAPRFLNVNDRSEWLNTTCNHTLYAIVDVFSQYYDKLNIVLLDDLFEKLKWCCLQDYEQLARSGTSCLETLIISNGQKFNIETWNKACLLLTELFELSTPELLLTWKPNWSKERDEDLRKPNDIKVQTFASILVRCVVQYEMIETVANIVFYPSVIKRGDAELWNKATQMAETCSWVEQSTEQHDNPSSSEMPYKHANMDTDNSYLNSRTKSLHSDSSVSIIPDSVDEHLNNLGSDVTHEGLYQFMTKKQLYDLVNSLLKSHEFAKTFNSAHEQRNLLWKAGFKGKAKPNLLKQETYSLSLAIRILFRLSDDHRIDETSDPNLKIIIERTMDVILQAIKYYRNLTTENHRESWNPILIIILSRFFDQTLTEEQFRNYGYHLYTDLCDLITLTTLPIQIRALYRGFLIRFRDVLVNLQ